MTVDRPLLPAAGLVILLALAFVLSVVIATIGWRNKGRPGGLRLAALMAAAGLWSGLYALELAVPSLSAKTLCAQLEYLGIATIPLAWFLFARDYSGATRPLSRKTLILLSVSPLLTFAIVMTNPYHHLVWSRVALTDSGAFPQLVVTHGPWFWVHVAFSYSMLAAGSLLLIRASCRKPRRYTAQAGLLFLATLAPWAGNATYVLGWGPAGNVDLTPLAFVITGLALAIDIAWLRLLRLLPAVLPTARDQLVQTMRDGVLVIDVDGAVVMANPAALFMLGLSERSLKARPLAEVLGIPALAAHSDMAADEQFEIALGKGDTSRVLDAAWSPLSLRGRIGMGRLLVMRDITDRKRAEEVLRESEFRYRSLFDNAHDLVFSLDREGRFLSANDAMARATGYALQEFPKLTIADLMEEKEYERLTNDFLPGLATAEHALINTELVSKDGDTIALEASVHLIRENGKPVGMQCISRDVTEQRLWEDALRHQALHDGVTSLPNRAFFRERLRQVAAEPGDTAGHAVLILDLDGFKEINDSFGHHCGDALLRQVGYRLERTMRTADIVARLGGDEFALIIPVADAAQGCRAALRVLDTLLPTYEVEGQTLKLSASVGVAICPQDGRDADTLLRHADIAMYTAKRAGGARYATYSAEDDPYTTDRIAISCELRAALERDELSLCYQPQIRCAGGSVYGVEALARWEHPRRGLIMPTQFVELAEQGGLVGRLTTWALRTAIDQCAAWRAENKEARVSVNLSARDLDNPDLTATLAQMLESCGVDPTWLTIEVTETSMMTDPVRTAASLGSLKALGVRIAVDDFGTGHSSLVHLRRMPVDTLKIDKSFVMNMTIDKSDAAIVRSTIGLAHDLGMTVVAEGVEDAATLKLLKAFGCDIVQGNHLGRPMPANAVAARFLLAQDPQPVRLPARRSDAHRAG
jgi:diguanylate cyclase (GGDEF)-like protein/PAS domain S-box-containing protein